jgi:leader peptidase (prepilin peptidase)/N-methyltransferase
VGGVALPVSLVVAVALAFGLVIGSFLNVVIHRLPRGESLVWPGSRCPHCREPIAPWHNVPLLSYLWLRGRCARCGARISPRYPAVELLTGLLFAAIAWRYGAVPLTPVLCVFAAALVAAAGIDLDHGIIPDEISVGGLGLALLAVPAARALSGEPLLDAALRSAGGALLGGGTLWAVGFGHARIATALGRRFEHWPGEGEALPRPGTLDYWTWFPGLGFGDVKLLALVGAVTGPLGVVETLLLASVAGLALGAVWALVERRWDSPYGFGPAIATGALLVVLLPRPLLSFGL